MPEHLLPTGRIRQQSVNKFEEPIMVIYGINITVTIAMSVVLCLLATVFMLITLLLITRSCHAHREHKLRAIKRQNALSVLLEQRADDENYLP